MNSQCSGWRIACFAALFAVAAAPASVAQVAPIITGPRLLPEAVAAGQVSRNGVVLCQIPDVAFCVWSEATGTVLLPGQPSDMNDAGMVVGSSDPVGGFTQAWIWTVAGGLQYIGTLGGPFSWAQAVNSSGTVVGQSATSLGSANAFAWTRDGGMVSLGTLDVLSSASDINDHGTVVGLSVGQDGWSYAVKWSPGEGMVDIGPAGSVAKAVNNDDMVVGWIQTGGTSKVAFVWSKTGGFTTLGPSFGVPRVSEAGVVSDAYPGEPGTQHAWAWTAPLGIVPLGLGGTATVITAMNDLGMVVGWDKMPITSETRAWVWTPTEGSINLGTLGGTDSLAAGVNNNGVVVGASRTASGMQQAFAWTAATGMVSLGPEPASAGSINDDGTITGQAWFQYAATWTIAFPPLYTFNGFLPPLVRRGSASLKGLTAGRTIPVKFQLTQNGQPTGAATATIAVYTVLDAAGTVDTTDLIKDTGAANAHVNTFRYDTKAQQYVFNLSTADWPAPATYRIVVRVSDGGVYWIDFSLR